MIHVPLKLFICQLIINFSFLLIFSPLQTQHHTRTLLASLHQSRVAYHNHKDGAQLSSVVEALTALRRVTDPHQLDCEAYHRLVVTARNVAVARPHNLVK